MYKSITLCTITDFTYLNKFSYLNRFWTELAQSCSDNGGPTVSLSTFYVCGTPGYFLNTTIEAHCFINYWYTLSTCMHLCTVYVFIFVGVIFVDFVVTYFSSSVAALLAQWSISFKAPPYSLPRDDGAIKKCTISLAFITEMAKGSKIFLFSP